MGDLTELADRLRAGTFNHDHCQTCRDTLAAADALDRLARWKAEATEVIEGWERVWDALGRPGTIGQSKSQAVLDLLTTDTVTVVEVPGRKLEVQRDASGEPTGFSPERRRVIVGPEDVIRERLSDAINDWPDGWWGVEDQTDRLLAAITGEDDRG